MQLARNGAPASAHLVEDVLDCRTDDVGRRAAIGGRRRTQSVGDTCRGHRLVAAELLREADQTEARSGNLIGDQIAAAVAAVELIQNGSSP